MLDLVQLIAAWSRNETAFFEDFEPAHGNSGHATASELVEELTRYLADNDDGIAYDGPALSAEALASALQLMITQQRGGFGHGVTRRLGQWRVPGSRQGEALTLWRVVWREQLVLWLRTGSLPMR